jgi:hypothetical protein
MLKVLAYGARQSPKDGLQIERKGISATASGGSIGLSFGFAGEGIGATGCISQSHSDAVATTLPNENTQRVWD